MHIEIYEDRIGEWRWRLVADNHETVAESGEGYTRERDLYRALALVRAGIGDAIQTVLEDRG